MARNGAQRLNESLRNTMKSFDKLSVAVQAGDCKTGYYRVQSMVHNARPGFEACVRTEDGRQKKRTIRGAVSMGMEYYRRNCVVQRRR